MNSLVKSAALLSVLTLASAIVWQYLVQNKSLPQNHQAATSPEELILSNKVLSKLDGNDPLAKPTAQNITAYSDKKQEAPETVFYNQTNWQEYATNKSENNSSHTNKQQNINNFDWLIEGLLYDDAKVNIESNLTNTYSNIGFELAGRDFSLPEVATKGNTDKHIVERSYFNYLALVLMTYQYPHNNEQALQSFSSWFERQETAGKKQVLKEAQDYIKIHDELMKLNLPNHLSGINTRMAKAYKEAGEKMQALASVNFTNTKELQDAVLEYNHAAAKVGKALISVSDYIQLLNIKFEDDEPGRLFVFEGMQN